MRQSHASRGRRTAEGYQRRGRPNRPTDESYSIRPVSYTHLVKPECLCASDCLALNYNLDKLEILERRIIRKILGPRKTSEGWKLRSNDEIYQSIETVSYTHLDVYKRQVL